MPSRRISANQNLAPIQEITINPYSSFNSDSVNMLTRMVTGGKNKDLVVAGLEVTGVNTVDTEVLGVNIMTEDFPSSGEFTTNWTGSNVIWDAGFRAQASIPNPLTSINATLTYKTLVNSIYVGQYIKISFHLTNTPKNLFVKLGNETKSYDHPTEGDYVCYIQLSSSGSSTRSLVFTIQLDSEDVNTDAIVYLSSIQLDPVTNMGTSINPITLPAASTPDLYIGTNLDSTNIPEHMLHPHIAANVLPGICIKDETTLSFTGTSNQNPLLTLNYLNPDNWVSGTSFGSIDFPNDGTLTYYTVDGSAPKVTDFNSFGRLSVALVDDGAGVSTVKIVGNTIGADAAYVKWAYLCVYYSYFKNPIPNNAYIGLVKESELLDARYGEDYLVLAKLRFVDAQTVDAIIYYPDRKDLAFIDATKVTYNSITQLSYWDTKPLNVSQALDALASKIYNITGGGGGGGSGSSSGEFNVRWGTSTIGWGWDPDIIPTPTSISEWATAYSTNSLSWVWSTISWDTDHWVAAPGAADPAEGSLIAAIGGWSNSKAYVVYSTVTGHTTHFRIINPINPVGDNLVRGPLTSEVVAGSNQLFLSADGSWEQVDITFPDAALNHSTLVLANYSEFQTWVTTVGNYTLNGVIKPGLNVLTDYSRLIFITSDNSQWRTPRDSTEATLIGTWSAITPSVNNVPLIFKPVSNEFDVRWGPSTSSITSNWSTAYTANSSTWIWSAVSWDFVNFKWIAVVAVGSPVAPTTNWANAAAAYPTRAYVVYNADDATSFRIINPYNPVGNGLVSGPTTAEVQNATNYLRADGSWKPVPTISNNDFYSVSGTPAAMILTPVAGPSGTLNKIPQTYLNGMKIRFIATSDNIGTPTINIFNPDIGYLGALTLYKNGFGINCSPVIAGDIIAGQEYEVVYGLNTSTGIYIMSMIDSHDLVGRNLYYADFVDNSIIDISSYNLSPINRRSFDIKMNDNIPALSSSLLPVEADMISNPIYLPLFNGNVGYGEHLIRHYCMNDDSRNYVSAAGGYKVINQVDPTGDTDGVSLISTASMKTNRSVDYGFRFRGSGNTIATTGHYVNLGNDSSLSSNTFTVVFNVLNKGLGSGAYRQIYCRNNSVIAGVSITFSDSTIVVAAGTGTAYTLGLLSQIGNGDQLAFVFNKPNISYYLNGKLIITQLTDGDYMTSLTSNTMIGRKGDATTNYYFNGVLSDFRIYNSVLTAANISDLANNSVISANPIRRYLMNDCTTNNTVIDSGTAGINGALSYWNGTAESACNTDIVHYQSYPIQSAFDFNGTSDYIDIGADSSLSSDTFSISFNLVKTGDKYSRVVMARSSNSDYDDNMHQLYFHPNGWAYIYAGGRGYNFMYNAYIVDGDQITITFSYPNIKVYLNKILISSIVSDGYHYNLNSQYKTSIGRHGEHPAYYFDGILSDVRIYTNKVLSQAEVNTIYNTPDTAITLTGGQSLRRYLMNDNGVTKTVIDSGTNNINGLSFRDTNLLHYSNYPKVGSGALKFNGVDDYISLGSSTELDLDIFSLSFWLMDPGTGVENSHIYGKCNSSSSPNSFHLYINSGQLAIYNVGKYTYWYPYTNLKRGDHILFTFNYPMIKFYLNGVFIKAECTAGYHYNSRGVGELTTIGRHGGYAAYYWNGALDDFRIYDIALIDSDIASIYNSGVGTEYDHTTTPQLLTSSTPTDYYNPNVTDGVLVAAGNTDINETQLVRHFFFDDYAANTIVLDSSQYAVDGTFSRTTNSSGVSITGKIKQAFKFNGTTDYIDLGNDAVLSSDTTSIAFWLMNKGVGTTMSILGRNTNNGSDCNWNLIIQSGYLRMYLAAYNNYYNLELYSNISAGDHIAIVFNYPTIKYYRNGIQIGADITTSGYHYNLQPTSKTSIGRAGEYTGFYFDGALDDFRIYSCAINESEINRIYNNGTGAQYTSPGLIRHFALDDNTSNTVVLDRSGHTNGISIRNTSLTRVSGKIGNAFKFNGTSDYIDLGNNKSLSSDTMSIAFWLVDKGVPYGGGNGFELYGRTGPGHNPNSFNIWEYANQLATHMNGQTRTFYPYSDLVNGDHIAFVFDYPTITFYLNGSFIKSVDTTGYHYNTGSTYATHIGNHGIDNTDYFNGTLDDFRIYDYPISVGEVYNIYNLGNGTQKTLDTSLIRHFYMDDNMATTNVIDSSGHVDGTSFRNTSLISATGKIGRAFQFNGSTDYINLGNDPDLSSDIMSIAFWLVNKGDDSRLMYFRSSESETPDTFGIQLWGGYLGVYTADHLWNMYLLININNGDHVCVTFNYPEIKMYINGILVKTQDTTGYHYNTNPTGITAIGRHGGYAAYYWNGALDDFRIYNKALNINEVNHIYNSGLGTQTDYCLPGDNQITLTLNNPEFIDKVIIRNKKTNFIPGVNDLYYIEPFYLGTALSSPVAFEHVSAYNYKYIDFAGLKVDKFNIYCSNDTDNILGSIAVLKFNRSPQLSLKYNSGAALPIEDINSETEYIKEIPINSITPLIYDRTNSLFNYANNTNPGLVPVYTNMVQGNSDTTVRTVLSAATVSIDTYDTNCMYTRQYTSDYNSFSFETSQQLVNDGNRTSAWWKFLPYKIPHGTKKMTIEFRNTDVNISHSMRTVLEINIDFVSNILSIIGQYTFSDNIAVPIMNKFVLSNTVTKYDSLIERSGDATPYYESIIMDKSFIYALPEIQYWIVKVAVARITSYM
jgi:hypothetical protein